MRSRRGFTLIELLIVVVIIGILAAIAIPKFANAKEQAYVAVMKSDLRNLATAQETYFGDYQAYAAATASGLFTKAGQSIWKPSSGVNIVAGGTAGMTDGWNAQVSRAGTAQMCTIFVGPHGSVFVGSAQQQGEQPEGEPTCY